MIFLIFENEENKNNIEYIETYKKEDVVIENSYSNNLSNNIIDKSMKKIIIKINKSNNEENLIKNNNNFTELNYISEINND